MKKCINEDLAEYVFCDFETTGVQDDDYPIEIGLVFCDKNLKILEKYESLVYWNGLDEEDIENEAFKIHGISFTEWVDESMYSNEVAKEIIEIVHRLYNNKKTSAL